MVTRRLMFTQLSSLGAISLLTGFWRGPTLVLVLVWKASLVEVHDVGPHDPRFKEDASPHPNLYRREGYGRNKSWCVIEETRGEPEREPAHVILDPRE